MAGKLKTVIVSSSTLVQKTFLNLQLEQNICFALNGSLRALTVPLRFKGFVSVLFLCMCFGQILSYFNLLISFVDVLKKQTPYVTDMTCQS